MPEYEGYNDPNADQGNPLDINTSNSNTVSQEGEGQPAGAPQQQDNFDPTNWALNFKGNEVYPKDKSHLVNLAQQGWSYSQSMESLNKRQKELDQLGSQYSTYAQLDEAMQKYPELAEKINEVYANHANGRPQTQQIDTAYDDQDPMVRQLVDKIGKIEKWQDEQMNKQADNDLTKSVDVLREKYPDQPWDKDDGQGTLQQRLLGHALSNNITDLSLAYKDLMWDSLYTNAQANALKGHKETIQNNFKNGIVDTGYTGSTQHTEEVAYNPKDDYSELTQKAIKMMGG